jgi:hypothetical protein
MPKPVKQATTTIADAGSGVKVIEPLPAARRRDH